MGHSIALFMKNIFKMSIWKVRYMTRDRKLLAESDSYTSFPLVSPFSIHSTVTLSLSSCSDVTIAWCIRPAERGCKEMLGLLCCMGL